jgi:hypothetical protein
MNWAGTLKDLGVSILIVTLGRWLDGIINWSVAALPTPKVVLPMPITIIIAAVVVVVAPINAVVVVAPIIASIVRAVI